MSWMMRSAYRVGGVGAVAVGLAAAVMVAPADPAVRAAETVWIAGPPPNEYALVGRQASTVYDPADANPAWLPIATAFDGGTAANPTRNFNLGFKTHYDFDGY